MDNQSGRWIFSGMQVLLDQQWVLDHGVIVENNIIKAIIPLQMIKHHLPAKQVEFPSTHYLIPGMIDLHIHGARGKDVMDANAEALAVISDALAAEGITSYLATTMTATDEQLELVLQAVANNMHVKTGAKMLGLHLEGPFIAASKAGAQLANAVKLPDLNLIKQWQKLANHAIKLITLAPELPGALELIAVLCQQGIIVSVGHTNATYSETMAAIEAGSSHATHLFNAMRGLHQREPGAVGALLLAEKITAEIIADGLHLHPAIVDLAWQMKGKERLLLVSDAMRAKCMPDGCYDLGGQMVSVAKGKAALTDGTLAGSTLRLPQAIKNMLTYTHCSLADAIYMATQTPARILGLSSHKGRIGVGMDADLTILNSQLEVVYTMREGLEVFTL